MNATMPQELITIASGIAAVALNALWQDALLVLVVAALVRAWPRLNASTRYTVWSATLVAAVLVPVVTTVPYLAAPPPPASLSTGAARSVRTPILTSTTVAARHIEPSVANGPGGGVASETLPRVSTLRFPDRFRLTLPLPIALGIALAWAVLAAIGLLRLTIGIVKLEALKRDALPLPVEYRDAMTRWSSANKGSREVRLCVSDDTDVPVAVGLFDSMILIPRGLLDELSETEVDQISLHELAHLRRADDWSNGLQRVLMALLAWNPAARYIGQQLDLEREVACDDWVLSLTGAVRPYALCLTKMAESSTWPRTAIPAPGVFATRKHISLRIERLLGAGRNVATNLSLAPTAIAVAVVGALAFAIAVISPSIAAPAASAPPAPVAAASPAPLASVAPLAAATEAPKVEKTAAPAPASTPRTKYIYVYSEEKRQVNETKVLAQTNPAITPPMPPMPGPIEVSVPDLKISVKLNQAAKVIAQAPKLSEIAQNVESCNGCDLAGVDWSGRNLHGSKYTGTDMSRGKFRGTDFTGVDFNGVDFSHADLTNANFRDAKLTGVDFSNANLTGTDFTGAKLNGSDFSGSNLTSANARAILASCISCDFSKALLPGMSLAGISINGVDFSRSDLRNVNFAGSTLTSIDFSGARLDGANFNGTTINGCDLSRVDLTHVDLSHARLIGTDLSRPHD